MGGISLDSLVNGVGGPGGKDNVTRAFPFVPGKTLTQNIFLEGGINDFYSGGGSVATVYADLTNFVEWASANGYKPYYQTVAHLWTNAYITYTYTPATEAEISAYNQLVLSNQTYFAGLFRRDLFCTQWLLNSNNGYSFDGLHLFSITNGWNCQRMIAEQLMGLTPEPGTTLVGDTNGPAQTWTFTGSSNNALMELQGSLQTIQVGNAVAFSGSSNFSANWPANPGFMGQWCIVSSNNCVYTLTCSNTVVGGKLVWGCTNKIGGGTMKLLLILLLSLDNAHRPTATNAVWVAHVTNSIGLATGIVTNKATGEAVSLMPSSELGVVNTNHVTLNSVTVFWTPSPSNAPASVAGFHVYFGSLHGTYTNVSGLISGTNYTVPALVVSNTYYFAATAVGTNGVESAYSNEAVCLVPPPDIHYTNVITVTASNLFSLTLTNPASSGWWKEDRSNNICTAASLVGPWQAVTNLGRQMPLQIIRKITH